MPSVSGIVGRARRFINYSALSSTARSVRRERLTYLSPGRLRRLETSLQAVLRGGVAGDILEFGMALGGSAIVLARQARRHGRHFHGFDVFSMIPPPTSDKDDKKSRDRYQVIASGQSKGLGSDLYYGYRDNLYGDVCRSFTKHGLEVDGSSISLHKGLFQDTLPGASIDAVAFAHVDCDWYEPVQYCLNSIADKTTPGAVIVLDDYHDFGGCRAATDEFIKAHPEFHFEDGANVILRRIA